MYRLRKMVLAGGLILAAVFALPNGIEQAAAAQVMDGVMGQSIEDETVYDTRDMEQVILGTMQPQVSYSMLRASNYDEYLAEAWTTEGEYTNATYYHRSELDGRTLFNGIDVSWWQGDSTRTKSKIDWEKAHDAGIDFVFVRVASRDTKDGSIYEDTTADAHIQGALENDINVGLYVFSQALDEYEAEEEAQYALDLMEQYGWDVTMPIIIDREPGSNKRLTAGMLSKEEETAVCNAFADVIAAAGYQPVVYSNSTWFISYMDMEGLEENGVGLWLARYNNMTDKPVNSVLTYDRLKMINYEYWQYSSVGKVDGYSGNLDMNFWYKDISLKTKSLKVTVSSAEAITLKWSRTGDAQMYRIYRYDSSQNKYVAIKNTSKTTYTDTDVVPGETYQYKVRCYWTIGGSNYYGRYSDEAEGYTLPDKVENFVAESQTSTSINLGWSAVHGADRYRIYQYQEESGQFEPVIDVTDPAVTSHQIAGLSGAKEYQFQVRAYRMMPDGTAGMGAFSEICAAVTKPVKTSGLTVEPASASSVKLSWKRQSGVDGYQVYRLNTKTGKYEKIATVRGAKTVTYTDTGLAAVTEYTYKVRAYLKYSGTNYYGACSTVVSSVTKPAKVLNLKLGTKSSTVTLGWKKQSGVNGYQIYRLNTKTGKYEKIATVKGSSKNSYQDKSVKKGNTYTYKVRAYKVYDGRNYYGSCSATAKLKVK